MDQSAVMSSKIERMDEQSKIDIVTAKQKSDARFAAGESLTKSGLGAINKGIALTKTKDKPTLDAAATPTAISTATAADDFATAVPGSKLGTALKVPTKGGSMDVLKSFGSSTPPPTMPASTPYVPPTSKIPVASPTYDLAKATVTDASGKVISTGGGGIGAGIKAFKAQRATNQAIKSGKLLASSAGSATKAGWGALSAGAKGNIIGAGASLVGAGIKKIGGDDDDTELNAAEWSGDLLSGAGTGIGVASTLGTIGGAIGMGSLWGSAVPGLGTAIGAVAGLGYGAWKALSGRKKARRAEAEYKAERQKKIKKHNKEFTTSITGQKIRSSQARMKSKQYSGYDLGRNYRAQMGGLRMGTPRYGYAV
jgi:hypothetical protein